MTESILRRKRAALINSLAGFGHCAIGVALPVLSAMGVECCTMPTTLLSTNGAYPGCTATDLTEQMIATTAHWKALSLQFDAIALGYFHTHTQAEQAEIFLRTFRTEKTTVLLDPVLGDNGSIYQVSTTETITVLRRLLQYADICTPNLTEACLLADYPYEEAYRDTMPDEACLRELSVRLCALGAKCILLTGLTQQNAIGYYLYQDLTKQGTVYSTVKTGQSRCSTGDCFAAVLLGGYLRGLDVASAAERAASFVARVVRITEEQGIPPENGVCFEPILDEVNK